MLTFIVMPCLNEATEVGRSILSLLRPSGAAEPKAEIIAVDNGSTDGTMGVLEELSRQLPGRVHLGREERRGYVPPRHRGVQIVQEISAGRGVKADEVLILQADADTFYRPGYVQAMQAAAADNPAVMLEGASRRPPHFERDHPAYVAAERMIDAAVEPLEVEDADDVVVDDKICAFRLVDYAVWGGLFEEWTREGDLIHAETSRLFIRARLRHGARKLRVNPAGAEPSRRKAIDDPLTHFATAGFPREAKWLTCRRQSVTPIGIDELGREVLAGRAIEAVRLRTAHTIALFRFLPALIGEAQGRKVFHDARDVSNALGILGRYGSEKLAASPGSAIVACLRLIDTHPRLFCST